MSNNIITEIANVYENEVLTEKDGKLPGSEGFNRTDGDSMKNNKNLEQPKKVDATKSTVKVNEETIKETKENKGMANESKFDQLFNRAKASILSEEDEPMTGEDPDGVVDTMDDNDIDVPVEGEEEGEEDEVDIADALQEIADCIIEIVSELRSDEEGEEAGEEVDVDINEPVADEGSIGEAVSSPTPKNLSPGVHKKLMTKKQKASGNVTKTSKGTGGINKSHITPPKVQKGWGGLQSKKQAVQSKIKVGKRITD